MLAECALIPDVFDSASYSSPDLCDVCLGNLTEYLLQEALVRDLRNGEWGTYVSKESGWHPSAKELVEKLISQRRLRRSPSVRNATPANYFEWCQEALASHNSEPLNGILASNSVAHTFPDETIVSSIEKLSSVPWWQGRSPSLRLRRSTDDYLRHLRLILSHANSLMFIDPHLDPSRGGYRKFIQLLQAARRPDIMPRIEIHRVCYFGSGPNRKVIPPEEWEEQFRENLDVSLKDFGLTVEVFIWDDFHDRYLITDIVGIGMQNGFDVTTNPKALTTWFRLGRKDRDDIQREFDPAAKRHTRQHQFTMGFQKRP